MKELTWVAEVSDAGHKPVIVAEYVLNHLGVFVKRERRVPQRDPLQKLTGFRIGYKAIPGTDYRAAPLDRNAILWQKVTSAEELSPESIRIRGNQKDEITLVFGASMRPLVQEHIVAMQKAHPLNKDADFDAASWLCWRDDAEWGDPYASLTEMIDEELNTERFLEPEVVEETVILTAPDSSPRLQMTAAPPPPNFCEKCGAKLYPDSRFCENCGAKVIAPG